MGLFESKEEKEKRIEREKNEKAKLEAIAKAKALKKRQIKNAKKQAGLGLANKVNPEDYTKIIIEQNQAIIGLLGLMVVNSSGFVGDAFSIVQLNTYYNNIKEYMNVDLDS